MNCREATRLMSEARDRKLSLREQVSLRLHWSMCAGCREFDRQMDFLRAAMRDFARRHDDQDPPTNPG